MSNLRLQINNGFLHESYDMIGKMENYVYLKLTADGQTRQFKSKIVAGEKKKPIVWNETITIPIPRNSTRTARLDVQIRDEDMTSDQVCGTGFINLDHCGFFQQGVTTPYTIRLFTEKKSQVAGELNFTSTFQ